MSDDKPEQFTKLPNQFFDAMQHMSHAEMRVILAVARKTCGWHKTRDAISLSQLEELTGLTRANVIRGVRDACRHRFMNHYKSGRISHYELTLGDGIAAIPPSADGADGITAIPEMVLQQYHDGIGTVPSMVSQQYPQKKGKETNQRKVKKTSRARKRDEVVSSNPVDDDDPFSENYDLAKLAPTLAALGQLPEQTTVESIPDAPLKKEKKEKNAEKRKSKATLTPEEAQRHAELFDGLARICVVDAKLVGGQIARYAKQLRTADAAANGETMDAFLEWWKTSDFRGKNGKPPMLAQVVSSWKQFKEGYAEVDRSRVGSKSNASLVDRIMGSLSFLGEQNNGN